LMKVGGKGRRRQRMEQTTEDDGEKEEGASRRSKKLKTHQPQCKKKKQDVKKSIKKMPGIENTGVKRNGMGVAYAEDAGSIRHET